MRLKFMILMVIVLIPILAYANDQGIEGTGGSLKVLNGENPSVQMVSEIVRMDIYPTYYDVKASFIFLNHGGPVNVKMGFPESGHGDINFIAAKQGPRFIKFSTYVDGKLTPAKRMMVSINDDAEAYQAYWVKAVSFQAKQQRKVDVIYRSNVGEIALPGIFAEYNFTGGNWYGLVKESQFIATLHLPNTYEVNFSGEYGAAFYGPYGQMDLVPEGNRLCYTKKNWQAEGQIRILIKNLSNGDFATRSPLSPDSCKLLDKIRGSWVNEDYIDRLEKTKSATKAMKGLKGRSDYQILTVNGKYAWSSEDNQSINSRFGDYIRDFRYLPSQNEYRLISSDNYNNEALNFTIDYAILEITEIKSLHDGEKFYLNKRNGLETVANEIVLAGKYQDDRGKIYIFSSDEIAHWPQQIFKYVLNISPYYDFDWFVSLNKDNGKPEYYAFEYKDGLLYLYKARDTGDQYEIKLKKDRQPFLILKPVHNPLPPAPENMLSMEYARYFNEHPGGKVLSQIEQVRQISKANSLSQEGLAFYKTNYDASAIQRYEEALKYYASPETYYRYGNSLSNISRLDDAIKAYQIAVDLKYDLSYLAYYNIACIYSRMNNSKKSFNYLELAINNGYRNFEHIQHDDDMAFLRSQPNWNDWIAQHRKQK